jgi:hypothetical protein
MTQPILAERGRPITEHNSRWKTLGAMWMQEFAQTLTNPERDALADGLALLLDRPDLATCRTGRT